MTFWAYLLRGNDRGYCAAQINNPECRIGAHYAGEIPRYIQQRRHVTSTWSQELSFHALFGSEQGLWPILATYARLRPDGTSPISAVPRHKLDLAGIAEAVLGHDEKVQ